MIRKTITSLSLVLVSTILLSGCGQKNASTPTPTTTKHQAIDIKPQDKPYISLTPRSDGHLLTLKIDNIPASITQIEYELIYSAYDQGNEIEKGLGDTVKVSGQTISRELLLGTESCTNGCKYKYDEGITGGTLTLSFINDNQSTTFETPFSFQTSADIKKTGGLTLPTDASVSIKATPSVSEFFVILRNFGYPKGVDSGVVYSVFSSGSGKGKINSVSPDSLVKSDKNTISGDYLKP